jgi:diadenosine tetraphosphatase ApaH/serine/threonine PP2A family protein phosphatase
MSDMFDPMDVSSGVDAMSALLPMPPPPCPEQSHGHWAFPLPIFTQPPAVGRWTKLIEKLLKLEDQPVSTAITQAELRSLVEDATRVLASEPTCLAIKVVPTAEKLLSWQSAAASASPGASPRGTPGLPMHPHGTKSRIPAAPDGAAIVTDDLVLVGDIHGQYADLLASVLAVQGRSKKSKQPDKTFLFLGDYVDRGPQSVETMLLLLAIKVEYPDRIYMIRGNHEETQTCKVYGFMAECRAKLQLTSWYLFTALFQELPLAAAIYTCRGKMFCCHGGLSPGILVNAEESLNFTIRQSYGQGLAGGDDVVDGLLWSDPSQAHGFKPNGRGCGFMFGNDATARFCEANHCEMVVRAHQMVQLGYLWDHDHRLLTVFSAPRYCGINDNLGAICIVHCNERWLALEQSQPLHIDVNTHQPLRVSPIAPTVGARQCPLEDLLEFVGFDTVIADAVVDESSGPTSPRSSAPPASTSSSSHGGSAAAAAGSASSGANVLIAPVAPGPYMDQPLISTSAPSPPNSYQEVQPTPTAAKFVEASARKPAPVPHPETDPTVQDYFGESLDEGFMPPPYDD